MNCPNCSNVIHAGNICPSCGIDVVLFEKTIKISDVLYNKGLAQAQANDLWNAADTLYKSIQFNKNNFYARNLLGLVFYESGRIGDALKHWVISASLVQVDNPASRYIEEFQKEGKKIDLFNDAIKMYNQALVYIQQKSDDLAMIQLKKAIEINPKFVDAMNLLTFCYLIQNDKSQAADCVNKVLSIDVNNPIALNYYYEIHQTKRRPKPTVNITESKKQLYSGAVQNKMTEEEREKGFNNKFYFAEIVSFLAGGLCTIALAYAVIFPDFTADKDQVISDQRTQIQELQTRLDTEVQQKQDEIDALKLINDNLTGEMGELATQVDVQEKIRRLNSAKDLYEEGEIEEAAGIIYALDPTGFESGELAEYETLKSNAYASAGNLLYNRGVSQINADEMENAKRSFEACLLYAPEGSSYIADATYYLGQIAESEEDFERAKTYYNTVIDNYPNSNRVSNARTRLNNIEE